jgi:hypothetical protein
LTAPLTGLVTGHGRRDQIEAAGRREVPHLRGRERPSAQIGHRANRQRIDRGRLRRIDRREHDARVAAEEGDQHGTGCAPAASDPIG